MKAERTQVKPCHFDLHLYYQFKRRRAEPSRAEPSLGWLDSKWVAVTSDGLRQHSGLMEASSSSSQIHFHHLALYVTSIQWDKASFHGTEMIQTECKGKVIRVRTSGKIQQTPNTDDITAAEFVLPRLFRSLDPPAFYFRPQPAGVQEFLEQTHSDDSLGSFFFIPLPSQLCVNALVRSSS